MASKFTNTEMQILRELRAHGVSERPLLLAVSGGLDSMVLLHTLARLNVVLKNQLHVAYIHHGPGSSVQKKYRDRAAAHVEREAKGFALPFSTVKATNKLKSENDYREFRWAALNALQASLAANALIVTAHHRDDLLETQMLRLIRGTALKGLAGFSYQDENRLRPLLNIRREEIARLAHSLKLKWLDDPSNKSVEPMRNWLRQKWLPQLEKKQRGATGSLARSIATISASNHLAKNETISELSRQKFMGQARAERRQIVAQYLLSLGVRDYSQGQIDEIIRRLDNRRGEFTFSLLRHEWRVNAQQIVASKLLS